ncbi:MAG: tetratricopeptide repeat protein [Bacteroidetes bacterium]|nr:tetratricopeptide repeat protein [Bacteroidota bacterium]
MHRRHSGSWNKVKFLLSGLIFAAISINLSFAQLEKNASPRLKKLSNLVFKEINGNPEAVFDSARMQVRLAQEENLLGFEAQGNCNIAGVWNWRNQLDSSLHYARRAREVALRSGLPKQISTGYNSLGIVFELRGLADSALAAYNKSLEWSQKSADHKGEARALLNIGMVYRSKGEFYKSLQSLHLAEKACLRGNFVGYLANLYLSIGQVYLLIGEQDLAFENLHNALRRSRKVPRYRIKTAAMEGLGDHAVAIGDTLEALCWYESSRQIAHDARLTAQEGQSSAKASGIYLLLGQMDAATDAAELAVNLALRDHDTLTLGRAYHALGLVDLRSGRYNAAVRNCGVAYTYASESGQTNDLVKVCDCLWRGAEKAGQPQRALRHYREYIELRDSLFNKENNLAIARLEARLDYERKHASDSLLQAAKTLQQETIFQTRLTLEQERSRWLIGLSIVAALLAFSGAIVGIVFKRQNGQLFAQNALIHQQKESIESALGEKEVLLREVHHRVKNNLQVMISLLEMQAAKVADLAALDALLASKGRVQAMTLIHQKLYQQQNIADLEFDAYLRQLVSAVCELYPDGSHVNVVYAVNPCSFGIDTAVPLGLILNELVTNAFKYAFAHRDEGTLKVSFMSGMQDSFELTVEDDGPGLPEGFDLQRTESLGMPLVQGLARQLKGTLMVGRSDLGGALFVIHFKSLG